MNMRETMRLVEGLLDNADEPKYGAGEIVTTETAPKMLFHGTNPIAAAMIMASGKIRADNPVDDDDLGAVVCATSSKTMGRNFAIEFERLNSSYDVGVVFEIDPRAAVQIETVPYHAETASQFEYEFRVKGDIPLSYVRRVFIVGKGARLKSERFLENLYEDGRKSFGYTFNLDFGQFAEAMDKLLAAARKPS
jgi:hypothetical protein